MGELFEPALYILRDLTRATKANAERATQVGVG